MPGRHRGNDLPRGILHGRHKNVKFRRCTGFRHEGEVKISEQHLQRVTRGKIFKFCRSGAGGPGFDKDMPTGLGRNVLEQRQKCLAMNICIHPSVSFMPDKGIGLRHCAKTKRNGRTKDPRKFKPTVHNIAKACILTLCLTVRHIVHEFQPCPFEKVSRRPFKLCPPVRFLPNPGYRDTSEPFPEFRLRIYAPVSSPVHG